jgi:heat shock protein HslJ
MIKNTDQQFRCHPSRTTVFLLFLFILTSALPVFGQEQEQPPAAASPLPFTGTSWAVERIGATPVTLSTDQHRPYLVFNQEKEQVRGFGGCNNFFGGYHVSGDKLQFADLATTMMACADTMELEQQFLQQMHAVRKFRLTGNSLFLLDENDATLLSLQGASQPLE